MSTLATLNVVLNGDVGGFLKSLKEAEGQSQSSGNLISRALGGIGDVVSAAAGVAVAGIGAITGAAVAGVAAYNSWADTLDSMGDVLGTNANESAGLAVAIRGVGGDVDALTGQMSKFAAGALADGKSLNPIQQELKDLGINIREAGKTSTVMGTALPSAKLNEFKDKLVAATAKLHDMEAAYSKSKNPTETATLNLAKQRDLVASLTGKLDAGGKVISRTIGADGPLKSSAQILQEVSDKLAKMPDGLEKTRLMTTLFGKSGRDLSDTLNALANGGLKNAEDEAQALGLAIGDDGVNQSIAFGKSLETVKMAGQGLAVSIGSAVMPLITPLIERFSKLAVSVMPQVRAAIAAAFEWIKANVGPIIQAVLGTLQNVVAWLQQNWPRISALISGAFEQARAFLEPIIAAIDGFIRATFGAIATFLQTHGEEIRAFIQSAWEKISNIVSGVVQIIKSVVTSVFGGIRDFIVRHGTEIQTLLSNAWNGIKNAINTVLGVIQGIINAVMAALKGDWQGAWNAIKGVVETIWNGIRASIEIAINTVKTVISMAWDSIRGGVESAWNAIKSAIEGAWNSAIDFIKGLPGQVFEWGKQIIQGIANGIQSMASAIWNALKNAVEGAWQKIKDLLGISSPSKLFATAGQQMMAGLALGITRNAQLPQVSLDAAMAGVTGAISLRPAGGPATPIEVKIYATVTDDIDLERLAQRVVREIQNRQG